MTGKQLKAVSTHVYIEDPEIGRCVEPCGLPEGNRYHDVPLQTPEQTAHEARRLGESRGER